MRRPIIGLTCNELDKENLPKQFINEAYINSVIRGGGCPMILPITNDYDTIQAQVNPLDGLIMTGGIDVNPMIYNENPEPLQGNSSLDRDYYEMRVLKYAKEKQIPIRIGVNSGSLEKDLIEKYNGVTAEGLVESALDKVKIIEDLGYDNLVISIKSSDVMMCVKAHELIARKTNYPLHVGITESGTLFSGSIKSSIGLGLILGQGIGDTIRVSLTDDPVKEIEAAKLILRTLGLRKGGIEVVSCPTCGRTNIDLIGLANEVEKMVTEFDDLDIKVAVMGCVVNGPGEAKEADIGIAGGKGEGLLIKKGQVVRKLPESELLSTLREELAHWNDKADE